MKSDLRTVGLATVAYTDSDSGAYTIDLIQGVTPSPSPRRLIQLHGGKRNAFDVFFFTPALMFKLLILAFSTVLNAGTFFCVFAGDDTLKTWDIRNFKKPLNVATGLCSFFPM